MTTNRKSIVTNLPIKLLFVDPGSQSQEALSEHKVNGMCASFSPDYLGMIIVSARDDGRYAILDGRNRVEVCRRVGYDEPLHAQVFYDLTRAEENLLYDFYNRKTNPSAVSKFHARTIWGDPEAVAITRIIERYGWKVAPKKQTGHFCAVAGVESVYENGAGVLKDGAYPDLVDAVVQALTEAWGHGADVPHVNIVRGLGVLIARFGIKGYKGGQEVLDGDIDIKRLVKVLANIDSQELVRDARALSHIQGGSVPACLASKVTALYNKRFHAPTNKLPEWTWTR